MAVYEFGSLPPQGTPPELAQWLEQEFRRIAEAFQEVEFIRLQELHAEPDRPRDGNVVLADGTDWDPGSGAGYYGYQSGSWTFLG